MSVAQGVTRPSSLNSMENYMETTTLVSKKPDMATWIRAAVVSVSLTAMLGVPAKAYTVPVVEIGLNTVNSTLTEAHTLTSQAEAFAEYGIQAERFIDTTQNWAQKLAQFKQIIASPIMPTGVTLKPVAAEWNVVERCGAGSILSLSGLMAALDMNPGGDIAAQQRNICAAIQMLENRKYNETILVVQKTMPDMRKVLDEIKGIRLRTKKEGGMTEAFTNAAVSNAYMEADFSAWEKQIGTYDGQIRALTKMQQMLAQRALKGSPSPLGTVVKAAALKAALSAK